MTRTVFPNAMVAHVWAQGTQESGKSGNGNFYFEGPALYSYGSHYLAGFLLPDGRALINGDSYSISTSQHVGAARSATRGAAYVLPGLTQIRDILTGAARLDSDKFATDQHKAECRARYLARLSEFLTGYGPKAKASAPFNSRANPDLGPIDPRAAALALQAIGVPPAKAETLAARLLAKRETNRKGWIQAKARAEVQADLATAKAEAARPIDYLVAEIQTLERSGSLDARRDGDEWAARGRKLHKAAKAAKAKGWTQVAAAVSAKYRLIRAAVKRWPDIEAGCATRAQIRAAFAKVRAARALLAGPVAEVIRAEAESAWNAKPSRLLADTLDNLGTLGLVAHIRGQGSYQPPGAGYYGSRALGRYLAILGLRTAEHGAAWQTFGQEVARLLAKVRESEVRREERGNVAALRAFRLAEARQEAGGAPVTTAEARAALNAADRARAGLHLGAGHDGDRNPWAACGWTAEAMAKEAAKARKAEADARAREKAEAEAAREAWEKAKAAAWIAGEPAPAKPLNVGYYGQTRLSDGEGGALIRAENVQRDDSGLICGGTLKTSWGAEVPLTHAVKAFRFLALVRAKAEADPTLDGWKANGRSLPVGHFRIESVDRAGNFKAGCHKINWPEVARLAVSLGLADLAPVDTTEPTPGH